MVSRAVVLRAAGLRAVVLRAAVLLAVVLRAAVLRAAGLRAVVLRARLVVFFVARVRLVARWALRPLELLFFFAVLRFVRLAAFRGRRVAVPEDAVRDRRWVRLAGTMAFYFL
ncbi:MAG: hypothetical protein O7J95_05490 [Planctomycetota bacterium]|nr:hypothetical protein [Planctomycetota bacterium]